MSKAKKSGKSSKSVVKVRDLKAKKTPKGGTKYSNIVLKRGYIS